MIAVLITQCLRLCTSSGTQSPARGTPLEAVNALMVSETCEASETIL